MAENEKSEGWELTAAEAQDEKVQLVDLIIEPLKSPEKTGEEKKAEEQKQFEDKKKGA